MITPTAAPTTGLTPKALLTRAALISAARQLTGQEGLQGVTVMAVCELANVGRTSFYSYFDDIEALILSVAETAAQQFQAGFEAAHGDLDRGLARLERCLSMILEMACKDAELGLLLAALSARYPDTRNLLSHQIDLELAAAIRRGEVAITHAGAGAACSFLTITTLALVGEFARGKLGAGQVAEQIGFLMRSVKQP